ncbi:hypothetical protein J4470_01700 [Candidatus Woesearchaeota archaeon]|nr:hypothetical protein [Candidatus Woesearchaeota archaeon]
MLGKEDFRLRWNFVKGVFAGRGYALLFVVLLASYLGFNFWINRFYETLPTLLSLRLSVIAPYAAGTVLISLLVALNITVIIYKLRQVMVFGKEVGVTAVGMFGGTLGGACPGCFVGVFPAVAGLFGVTATLSSLPFLGFEILIPTLLVALVALYLVAKPLTCAPDNASKKKNN